MIEMKWYDFDAAKGSRQKRPPLRKYVLVRVEARDRSVPEPLVVGYRKNGGGDKQSPYFVIPGRGGIALGWCDCLPDDFVWPLATSGCDGRTQGENE